MAGAVAIAAEAQANGDADAIGSFAHMFSYALGPVLVAGLFLGSIWALQYLRRRTFQTGKATLLVHKSAMVWALATAFLGMALSLVVADRARNTAFREAQLRFMQQIDRSESAIQQEVQGLVKPLSGVRGTFVSSDSVDRREFGAMIEALDLRRNYPGIRGIGFVERVKSAQLSAYLAQQERVDGKLVAHKVLPGVPPELVDEHYIVKFMEPYLPNRAEIGLDFASDPLRREAMRTAMEAGEPAMTPRTTLAIDPMGRPGFLVFMPVYSSSQPPPTVGDRTRQLRGWAFAPVIWAELMAYGSAFDAQLADIQIFDGAEVGRANLLYDSNFPSGEKSGLNDATEPHKYLFSSLRPVLLLDQVVYLRVSSGRDFEATVDRQAHLTLAVGGTLLSVLAALVVWLLMAGRMRAENLARSMTADLDRLAMVAQRTSNAVVITDAQQRITWVNEGFTRITGYTAEEAVGRVPAEFLQTESTDREVTRAIGEDMRAGRVGRHIVLNRRKDGQHYWNQLEIQPLFRADGRLSGYMSMQQDVSAEIDARDALAREKERAENILEGTGVGTWESNLVTGESLWSDRWSSMMGYTRAEMVPDADGFWRTVLHPEDRQRLDNAAALCIRGDTEGFSVEVRARRKDGNWMWILSRARAMTRLPDGRAEWLGGIHTDITEFKRTESSLRDAEAFLDRAGRIAGVGAWQIDLRTDEIIWSDQTCAIHGVPAGYRPTMQEMLGFYSLEAGAALRTAITQATELGKSWDLTSPFINAQGQQRWVRSFGDVEFDDGGAVRLVGAFQDVTRDLESQAEVQRSGALLRGAIDAINEAFVVYDPQDRLVLCNDKYRDLYAKSAPFMKEGVTFESILRGGLSVGQYAEAVGREEAWLAERLAIHHDGNATLEQQLADGRWLKVVERKMPDGHIVGFRVDVTSLKQATARAETVSRSLALEQYRLQSILEGTNVGTWEWNVESGAVTFNARWAEIAGYTLEELAPIDINTWIRLSHPDDLQRSNERLMAHFEGRSEFYECEVRMRHKDGRWVWVLDRGRVSSRTALGKPLTMSGTHMDITERKTAENALAQTSSMLQNVLDSAVNVGIISTGVDRVVRVFNKGAENLLGYRAADVVGIKTSSRFFDLTELAVLSESLELQYGRTPTTQEVFDHVAAIREPQEWSFVRADGERFKASLIISPMADSSGQLLGHLAIIYDISRQKEYEASLRNAMHLAEQSSVSKSQFLANMSHEIRTPMNAILGMLQLLNTTALDSRQDDYVEKAKGAARSLLGLLNDILDFSKVEAGKMQLAPEVFELETLLSDLSVILASNLGDKNVDLVFEVDPSIPAHLIGDALRLKQVLINLGGNAVKFTEQGHVVIRWAVLARTVDRIKLQISVRDTGIGIAQENQARIFEAFTQAEANTTRRFGGTGLGLVISTRLIRLMGGELELKSVLGEGSSFSFNLEFPLSELGTAVAPRVPMESTPRRVLLVDDNPVALDSSVSMARSLGWDVAHAASGQEAMLALAQQRDAAQPPFDVVFVDARMPEQSGLDTVRAMRQWLGSTQPPKFILMGAHQRSASARLGGTEDVPVDGVLAKPLTARMLAQALTMVNSPSQVPGARSGQAAGQALLGMRILLVEDNLINQQVASELLKAQGAVVTVADNGLIGVNAIKAARPPFDAVLMDLQMPVMDGLTAARLLRQDARLKTLPVIAMTANAMATDREACLLAGMNDHVGKPFDVVDLVKTLVRHTQWSPREPAPEPLQQMPRADATSPLPHDAQKASNPWPGKLDIELALARMGGNRGLLQRAIDAFIPDARMVCQRIASLLQKQSTADVRRELHSFKGVAATLGATQLAALAARAEKAVDAVVPVPPLSTLLLEMDQLVAEVLPDLQKVSEMLGSDRPDGALTSADAAEAPEPTSVGLSQHLARAQLVALLEALRESDMVAMELHAVVRQQADPALSALMEPLDAAMADLEFERAAVECEKLVAQATPP